jgi:hypothetical protein
MKRALKLIGEFVLVTAVSALITAVISGVGAAANLLNATMTRLKNRIAIVTGAAGGSGHECAE